MTKVISIENLGKSYMIGHQSKDVRYVALRDVISEAGRKLWSRLRHPEYYTHENVEEFWALQNLNLEINEGDRLGIIGRNGAGKTTLLKLISRITDPTKGQIKIKGRVASLLEVGTGFHPELTGRENVYLNGAILGMSRKEIKSKFDEIVDFAGVEQFLDTPVKRYSSGMHVRLGFSVAAHLEPEILVVDEVLAVGDAAFQKKCIGKMNSVAKQGRTILFVSHQMQAITNLCNKAILLDQGKMIEQGDTHQIVQHYLKSANDFKGTSKLKDRKDREGRNEAVWVDTWIENENNEQVNLVQSSDDFYIVGLIEIQKELFSPNFTFAFAIYNSRHEQLSDLTNRSTGEVFKVDYQHGSRFIVRCKVKNCPLVGGMYTYNMMLRNNYDVQDFIQGAGVIQMEDGDFFKTGKLIQKGQGSVLFMQEWKLQKMPSNQFEMSKGEIV